MSARCRTIKGESTSDSAGGIASSISLYSLARSSTFVFRASTFLSSIWLFFLCLAGTTGGGPEVPAATGFVLVLPR